jgi:hypothetical protein
MLRAIFLVSSLGLAAACSDVSEPAVGLAVRGDDGTVIGRVASVERDAEGRLVSAEIPELEPADAPEPVPELLAEDERFWATASASGGGAFTASR